MNTTKAAPDTAVFPSQEFHQSLADALKRQSDINAEIEKNSRMLRISKEKEHRESAELRGEDPNRITKDLDLSLKQKEREAQLVKQQVQSLFSAQKEHFKDVNHKVQTRLYSAIVEPRNTRLRAVELAVEGAISELLAIVSGAQFGDDPTVTDALEEKKQLDAGITEFNELAKEHSLPGNLRILPNELPQNPATDAEAAITQTMRRVNALFKKLEGSRSPKVVRIF